MAKMEPDQVTPRSDGKWNVQRGGGQRAFWYLALKRSRVRGRRLARDDEAEFLMHGRDGRIRERDSYGNDPFRPPG